MSQTDSAQPLSPSHAMSRDQALGMFVGLFIGDAMGAPLEFTKPNQGPAVRSMIGGGSHKVAPGEWTDDGAMAMCIADAYLSAGMFDASATQKNFMDWSQTGKFGTRDYCFDVGMTITGALNRVKNLRHPYAGSTDPATSGNGCIMRMAPCIVWNRDNLSAAIGESVAQAVLTHGSTDSIRHTAALAHELWVGTALAEYDAMRDRKVSNSGYVADTYASAWHSVLKTSNFEDAVVDAINRGGDADTVGAVTGMIAGRIYGYAELKPIANLLVQHKKLVDTGTRLWDRAGL
jgi:ADP-ribosyl-[dinitrogen reductase] hydrolase